MRSPRKLALYMPVACTPGMLARCESTGGLLNGTVPRRLCVSKGVIQRSATEVMPRAERSSPIWTFRGTPGW